MRSSFTILFAIGYFGIITGEIPAESSSAATSSECYDDNLTPACPSDSQIAITSYYDGFKAASLNCPVDGTATGTCCTYDVSGDCLQEAPTETRYVDEFSGRDSGIISTSSVSPSSGGTCDSVSYSPVSVFSQMTYLCIPSSRTLEMCTSGTHRNSLPVYLQNRGYSTGTSILSTDTSCNCSVENSAYNDIIMYVINMDLYDVADCRQSFTIRNEGGTTLGSYDCTDLEFNKITNVTFTGPYLVLNLLNSYTTNAGKIWIGFQAAATGGDIILSCPKQDQQFHVGCPQLSNTTSSTVTAPNTAYNSVATYACRTGYNISSGDVTRTCQADNNWSGTELICALGCSNDSECDDNFRCDTVTNTCRPDSNTSSGQGQATLVIVVIVVAIVLGLAIIGGVIYMVVKKKITGVQRTA